MYYLHQSAFNVHSNILKLISLHYKRFKQSCILISIGIIMLLLRRPSLIVIHTFLNVLLSLLKKSIRALRSFIVNWQHRHLSCSCP
jgi:hypothetical protein